MTLAVRAAYGWPYPLAEEEILKCLIALNQRRFDDGRLPY
jgi:hypothetical protein